MAKSVKKPAAKKPVASGLTEAKVREIAREEARKVLAESKGVQTVQRGG